MSKDTDENQPVSIEDEIRSVIDSAEDEVIDDTAEEQVDEEEAPADVVPGDEEPEPNSEPEDRGEPDPVDEEIDTPTEDSEPSDIEDELEAPEHWAAADRETFNNQTPEAKDWLLKRHREMEGNLTRKSQEFATKVRTADAVQEIMSPYEQEFAQAGLDITGAVRQLASWHTALKTGGRDTILKLADTYKIDLSQPAEDEHLDPELKSVKDELRQIKEASTRQNQAAQQEQRKALEQSIQSFETETDEAGNLKNPHFAEVYDDMSRLFSAKLASDLPDAYQKALALRPDLTVRKEPAKVVTKEDKAAKVKKAKKAATGVRSSGAVGKLNREKLTLEEEIASHF